MLREIFNPQNYYWNPWAIPNFIASCLCLFTGFFIFIKNRKQNLNRAYFVLAMTSWFWQFGYMMVYLSKELSVALFWGKFAYIGVPFISASLYFYIVSLLGLTQKIKLVYTFYCMAFIGFILNQIYLKEMHKYYFGYYVKASFTSTISLMLWCIPLLLAYVTLYKYSRKSGTSSLIDLKRRRLIFIAYSIVYPGAFDYLNEYGIGVFPSIGSICTTGLIFTFAYAIIRYRLMDIDTVIHKTIMWVSTIVLLLLPLGVLGFILKRLLPQTNIPLNISLISIYVLFSVGYYNRFRSKIDHLFRRRKYDYQTILGKVAEKVATTINIEDLTRQFLTEVCDTMYLRNSLLYVLDKDEKNCFLMGRRGYIELEGVKQTAALEIYTKEERSKLPESQRELSCDSSLYRWLAQHQDILEKEQVEIDPQYQPIKQEAGRFFQEQELELIIPLVFENKVTAILGLGKKENLQAYTIKDLELLKKLGQEVGVTVYNALHHEDLLEKERLDEEMKMGRQIQMSLLPQEIPQVRGLNIQGLMQPAKEIGGDYYDFIILPDKENLAIVIGDVSGKGVAAGLLMSMAKATIHTLSQEGFSPREILLRTNQFPHQHIGGQKFMTLLYLLWQSKTKTLAYSSAGHEHILIYHSSTAQVEAVLSGGFMLGMIADIDRFLEEKQIKLEPHDKVLLYTDGVTEAENQDRNRFGLERLKETYQRHSQKPAAELMQAIKEEVYTFIGAHPQYDDITLVVMEAV